LSGGQRQRIAIARAIVADAPIIVLDEATAGLDSGTERRVVDGLRNLATDRAVIVVAHSPGAIVHADRILRLDEGRLRPATDDDVVEAAR
jgi:ABC-type multidrug transport system fused ATPase/permease subunit